MEYCPDVKKPKSFGSLSRDFYYANLLIDEVIAENLAVVKRLLVGTKARVDTVVPERGAAALHLLAGLQNEDFSTAVTTLALLKTGTDPNVRSEEGLTPIHVAAMYGRCKVLEVLLTNGGNPSLIDYRLLLDAEGYAMKEQQWRAYWVLTSYAAIVEDPDRFAKYLVEEDIIEPEVIRMDKGLSRVFQSGEVQQLKQLDKEIDDYDWLDSTQKVLPLNENAVSMIRNQRMKTETYQYPVEDTRMPIQKENTRSSLKTKLYSIISSRSDLQEVDKDTLSSFKTKLSSAISRKHDTLSTNHSIEKKRKSFTYSEKEIDAVFPSKVQQDKQLLENNGEQYLKEVEKEDILKAANEDDAKRKTNGMYYCEYAGATFEQKHFSKRDISRSPSLSCSQDDSFFSRTSNNKMLCKMSRIFLFMLRKRQIDPEGTMA